MVVISPIEMFLTLAAAGCVAYLSLIPHMRG
jgi:hypothetical protein